KGDAQAANLGGSLDLQQTPRQPTVLPLQHCPASDYSNTKNLQGRVEAISKDRNLLSINIKPPSASTILTLEANNQMPLSIKTGERFSSATMDVGDWIAAVGTPDPDKA